MRIAQVAPLFESVPPKLYGGTERVVSYLTEELVRCGHEVTLFASGDSQTTGRLMPGCARALWRDSDCRESLPHHLRQLEQVFEDESRFDVIHFHGEYLHFPFLRRQPFPSVTTLHSRLHASDLQPLFSGYAELPLISISDSQRRPVPDANWLATVYHGIPRNLHTFRNTPEDYLAFLGRISPEKRLDRAIAIARGAGMKLKIAAKIYPEERDYYHQTIEPLIRQCGSSVEFIGEVGGRDKDEFLGKAVALLFPIDWAEPFGLVMIEALACGTPVIAWRNGSVPEIIDHGVTGYIVDSIDEAVDAVQRVTWLERRACRAIFERRFDAARMTSDYVRVYQQVLHTPADAVRFDAASSEQLVFPAVSTQAYGMTGPAARNGWAPATVELTVR